MIRLNLVTKFNLKGDNLYMQEIVQSVDRTLSIIEVLSDYEEGLGITDISEKVNLHKSTVHRLLNTLIYKGYVMQDSSTNKYGLTLKLFELGNKRVEQMNLVSVAEPYLKELMERTEEVVHLVVREKSEIVYVSKVEPQKTIRMYSRIGKRMPIYSTAVGKAMMANMNEKELDKLWNESDVRKLTEKTIVDLGQMKEHLEEVKLKGYAIDEQENEQGLRCIGAVLKNYNGNICGAISVSGSILSFTEDKVEKFAPYLIEYARIISRELGYKG